MLDREYVIAALTGLLLNKPEMAEPFVETYHITSGEQRRAARTAMQSCIERSLRMVRSIAKQYGFPETELITLAWGVLRAVMKDEDREHAIAWHLLKFFMGKGKEKSGRYEGISQSFHPTQNTPEAKRLLGGLVQGKLPDLDMDALSEDLRTLLRDARLV